MTNTFNRNKIKYFTKFDWPRVTNPKITFPLNKENLENVRDLEKQAISEIETAVADNPDDIVFSIENLDRVCGQPHLIQFVPTFFIGVILLFLPVIAG